MNDKDADRLFDSILTKHENVLARKILANFNQLTVLIKSITKENGIVLGNILILENQRKLEQILIEAYEKGITSGVAFTRQDLGLPEEKGITEVLTRLSLWIRETAVDHAKELTNTTINIFNKVLSKFKNDGLEGDKLDSAVLRETAKRNRNRVGTIATTEAQTGLQQGILTEAQVLQAQVLKRWRSQEDRSVRDTHARANSRYRQEPIPLNQDFIVGGYACSKPLDPRLPPEESINCRCYTRLTLP